MTRGDAKSHLVLWQAKDMVVVEYSNLDDLEWRSLQDMKQALRKSKHPQKKCFLFHFLQANKYELGKNTFRFF